MASIADYDRSALDRSLNPALDFMASHPVYRDVGVKSGRRNKASNRSAGGAKKSQHLLGKALDLDVSRLSNAQKAQLLSDLAGYGIKGIGIYDNNNIHIDARKNFATWGANRKNKYAGVDISQQPKWARPALTAIQQAGPYKAFPAAPAAQLGETGLGPSPSGASLADVYGKAQYQRAMPPSLPAEAPRPSVRPGGLGALRLDANQSTIPSVMQAAYSQWARPMAEDTLSRMATGQNMPVTAEPSSFPGRPPGPVGALPAASPASSFPARPPGPVGALPAAAFQSDFPGRPPGPIGAMPSVQRDDPAAVVAGFKEAIAQDRMTREVGPTQRFRPDVAAVPQSSFPARPAPSVRPSYATTAPAPTALRQAATGLTTPSPLRQAATGLTTPSPLQQAATGLTVATPGATPKQDRLPASVAVPATAPVPTARPTTSVALNPDRVKDDVVASTPAAAAVAATTTPEIAFDTPAAAPASTPAQAAVRAQAATRPAAVADPWGGVRTATVDPATTQAVADPAHPSGFWGKVGDIAQRNLPAIAGSLIGGPIGGLLGMGLGRAFDNAQPGQLLGNPFQGLGGSLKAMGMFQSGTPYAGPVTRYGTGLRAISDVLGGQAPVGSRAYSRSTPGYSVTSLPNGMVQKTNQYGFTSFERPSTGPTASSFPGGFSAGPGGVFSGWGGGGVFGGGSRKSEKTEKSGGGGRSSGGGATGHSKSSRY